MGFSRSAFILVSIPLVLFIIGLLLSSITGLGHEYTYNIFELIKSGLNNTVVLFEIGIIFLLSGALTQLSLIVLKSDSREDKVAVIAGIIIIVILIAMLVNLIVL